MSSVLKVLQLIVILETLIQTSGDVAAVLVLLDGDALNVHAGSVGVAVPSASCVSEIKPASSATMRTKLWRVWCRCTTPTLASRAYRFRFLTKACEVAPPLACPRGCGAFIVGSIPPCGTSSIAAGAHFLPT